MKYWSYRVDANSTNVSPFYLAVVAKHGSIYVNRMGGWMPVECADIVHKSVVSDKFPSVCEETQVD
jgi:hypothetical protein